MSGLKGEYYWIRTSVGIEIGHKRESGNWSLIGIGAGENMNSEVLEVIGEVKANNPTTTTEPALNIDLVSKSFDTRLETPDGTFKLSAEDLKRWISDGYCKKGAKFYGTVLIKEF